VTRRLELLDSVSPIVYLIDSSADGTVYDGVLRNSSLFAGKIRKEYQVDP
jgi:hypothetical protein